MILLALSLFLGDGDTVVAKRPAKTSEIVVTGTRTPVERAKLGRAVDVLTAEDVKELPARSPVDLLQYVPGVDLRQRGPAGIQADVSIRGGSFDQTGVLVDGMRMNDMQTGHHSLNIPVNVHDVERIEIVKGGASRLFGSGSIDGAINVITKRSLTSTVHGSLVGGDFDYRAANVSASLPMSYGATTLSLSKQYSGGYRQSTDFNLDQANLAFNSDWNQTKLKIFGGVVNKAFGANGFYSGTFPNQWEHTVTWTAGGSLSTPLADNLELLTSVVHRINSDEFLLKRDTPTFYRNLHITNQFTGMAQLNYTTSLGVTSLAFEGGSDDIVSTNLKDHNRVRGGVALEQSASFNDFFITAGAAAQGYSDRVPAFTGGLDISYQLVNDVRLYGTVNRSMRIPTYTELYYTSRTSIGDSTLVPETSLSYEVGANIITSSLSTLRVSGYIKSANNLIDYAPVPNTQLFKASNVLQVDISGIEVQSMWRLNIGYLRMVQLGGIVQNIESSNKTPTFYLNDNLNYQGVLRVTADLPYDGTATVALRAFQRLNTATVKSTLDARVNVPLYKDIYVFAEATNIYNTNYIETGFVVMPPRWFRLGFGV